MGALAVSMWMTFSPLKRRAGSKMLISVAIFGGATAIFGLSKNLYLSLLALTMVGASDMVSVVVRSSMLQLASPLAMRGRVSAVNSLFVSGSNELGEFESGLTAQWLGAVRAVVIGGIGSLIVTGIWSTLFPDLRQADELTSEALLQVDKRLAAEENIASPLPVSPGAFAPGTLSAGKDRPR
jgi:MFS family permease